MALSIKACCGLFAGKDEEDDHDYELDHSELPRPTDDRDFKASESLETPKPPVAPIAAAQGGEGLPAPAKDAEGVAVAEARSAEGTSAAAAAVAPAGPPAAKAEPPPPAYDLAGFITKLDKGVLITKINRQGKPAVRLLFYDEETATLSWNEPGATGMGHGRPKSRLSLKKVEQPLPIATLVEMKMAHELNPTFCSEGDLDKSFQMVFPARSVDIITSSADEANMLVTGFRELKKSVMATG